MNLMQVKINANATSDTNDYANGSNVKQPKVAQVGTMNPNAGRRWWSSLLLLGIVFSFGLGAFSSNYAKAQTNPYYPSTTTPPTIQQTTNDSTGAIEVNICAPDAERAETFSVYKEVNGVKTLLGSGTLKNDANLSVTIPNEDIIKDMILEVTSKHLNSNVEFIEWRDTATDNKIIHDYSFVWNPNNPYDSIGFLHNEMLDYYALNRDNNIVLTNMSDIIADVYNTAKNFTKLDYAELQRFNQAFFMDISKSSSFEHYINGVTNSTVLSAILNDLFDILRKHDNKYNTCNAIKLLENEVNLLTSLSANDKKIFFGTSSIARFSSTYWLEVEENEGAGEYWPEGENQPPTVGPWTRACIDASAYAAYVATTGPVGILTGLGVANTASTVIAKAYESAQAMFPNLGLPDLP